MYVCMYVLKVVNFIYYGGPQLSHQIQITHIKYKIPTSKTRLNGQHSEDENYVQFHSALT